MTQRASAIDDHWGPLQDAVTCVQSTIQKVTELVDLGTLEGAEIPVVQDTEGHFLSTPFHRSSLCPECRRRETYLLQVVSQNCTLFVTQMIKFLPHSCRKFQKFAAWFWSLAGCRFVSVTMNFFDYLQTNTASNSLSSSKSPQQIAAVHFPQISNVTLQRAVQCSHNGRSHRHFSTPKRVLPLLPPSWLRNQIVGGSQIYRWKRGQFAAPTAAWCTARRLGVEEVLSRRNLEGITPILRHCGARGDHRSNGGRQEAPGVTTKLLQSWDVQPYNRFNMQQVTAATNPASLPQITRWFTSKVM